VSEAFLIRTVGGPFPGDRICEGWSWPLPETLDDPEQRGIYRKVSESDLPPQAANSHVMRGAQYEWESA
jgi:hypothetical protein